MRSALFYSLLLFCFNSSFAQEINDNTQTDSISVVTPNELDNTDISGYASKISHENFIKGAVFSPLQLIQGKVPGFVINCLNVNDPNPDIQIQSRGISTLLLSSAPLYIIDGIPMEKPDIVPVENIESIEVLKNLSQTAPYGIRGGNGVVIIKTKSYISKPLTVTYSTYIYGETYANKSSYMSASEWRKLKQSWASSSYSNLNLKSSLMRDYNADTDWRKEISQKKLSQAHNLGFFGSYKKTTYSAMLNLNNHNGIIQKTGNKLYGGQLTLSQQALNDKLQVDVSAKGTLRKYSAINDNPFLITTNSDSGIKISNIFSYSNSYNPTIPIYNTDGSYGIDSISRYYNPLFKLNNTTDERELLNTLFHIQASYAIVDGLKISSSWSQYKIANENSFSNENWNFIGDKLLSEIKEKTDQKERLYSIKLNYCKLIDLHSFDISFDYSNRNNVSNYTYLKSTFSKGDMQTSSNWAEYDYDIEYISGSFKYNFKNKYYLSLVVLNESAQYFSSLSLQWKLNKEKYLTNISCLDEFNIRAGYGVGQRMVNFHDKYVISSCISVGQLQGEKMKEGNIGVDLCLLSNRLCFSADYYHRNAKDVIINTPKPASSQFPSILYNGIEIQNSGWELYLKAQPLSNHLKWGFDFNISFNKNTLLSNDLLNNIISTNDQSVGDLYGFQFAGYSTTNEILVYDDNGNLTNNRYDYYKKLGNGVPKSFFGFTNTFEYKKIDLSIFIRGGLGFQIVNSVKLDYYKKILQSVDQRDIVNAGLLINSDYFIENGSYVKIANVSLGYKIPMDKRFIKSAKIYVACNNVALFTKATDVDPEKVVATGVNAGRYYYEKYPDTQVFLMGLNVSF